jgi:hypothetical protein
MKLKNTGNLFSKHARNNTNVLFESIGMSNYEYVLQGQAPPSEKPEVKVIDTPKYEYYITPKEIRDNEI